MSYRCDYCNTPQPQGTKLILTTPEIALRKVQYSAVNAITGLTEVVGLGTERTGEFKVCRPCLELPPIVPTPPVDMRPFLQMARGYIAHANGCQGFKTIKKKNLAGDEVKESIPCRICELIIRDYAGIPLAVMNKLLEDPKPPTFKTPLVVIVRDNAIDHCNNKGQKDLVATMVHLKTFQSLNPKFFPQP